MIIKWKLDSISKNKNNDLFLRFNDYGIIIYKEFAAYYIKEFAPNSLSGIYKSSNTLFIGKMVTQKKKAEYFQDIISFNSQMTEMYDYKDGKLVQSGEIFKITKDDLKL
jgi:hypothetical protein